MYVANSKAQQTKQTKNRSPDPENQYQKKKEKKNACSVLLFNDFCEIYCIYYFFFVVKANPFVDDEAEDDEEDIEEEGLHLEFDSQDSQGNAFFN